MQEIRLRICFVQMHSRLKWKKYFLGNVFEVLDDGDDDLCIERHCYTRLKSRTANFVVCHLNSFGMKERSRANKNGLLNAKLNIIIYDYFRMHYVYVELLASWFLYEELNIVFVFPFRLWERVYILCVHISLWVFGLCASNRFGWIGRSVQLRKMQFH